MTLSELNRHEGLTHDVHSYICVHWWKVMKHNMIQDRTYVFFGLYTCVLMRLFSLCASFVTLWACYIDSDYSCCCIIFCTRLGFQVNEVITQISRYFLLDYWSTMWKTSALHQRLKYFWWLSLISNKKILEISDDFTLIVPWRVPCTSWAIHTFPAGHHEEARVKRHQITNYAFHHCSALVLTMREVLLYEKR